MEEKEDKKINPITNMLVTEWEHLENKKTFILYITLFFIAGGIYLLNPLVIGMIFNSIQEKITTKAELNDLILKIWLLLLINISFWIFHGTARVLEQKNGFLVKRRYVNTKINRVLDLPVSWHKDHHSGDTIDKINKGGEAISEFAGFATFRLVYGLINLVGSVIILCLIDFWIGISVFIFSSFVLFVITRFDKKLNRKYKKINEYENKASASIFDYVSNIFTVISLRLKKRVSEEIDTKILASKETYYKSVVMNESKWAFASVMISLMTVTVLSFRAHRDYLLTGTILIGTLYMLYGYLRTVGDTFYTFASLYGELVRANSKILSAKIIDEDFKKIKLEKKETLPAKWKELEIKSLGFTYDQDGTKKHLENVDLKLIRGQKIALIGESGSGKSTVLTILRGLYTPEKGELYCDGLPLEEGIIKLKDHITLIPQDPEIFNNTIRFNITLDLPYSEEELNKVIEIAQLKNVIAKLEKGLETNVMERGVSLSGGEKQRLALARGLLAAKDSDILLLDEPTSSVDSTNEAKIYDGVFQKFAEKTVISSIHKLHLLDKFDRVIIFENGKIVANASYNQIKKNKKFEKIIHEYKNHKDT